MNQNTQINVSNEIEQWNLMLAQANHLVKSGALPSSITKPEQAVAIIQYGRELGVPPMTALQNISLIKGKPTLSASLIASRLKKAGYKYKVTKYLDDICEIVFTDLDGEKSVFTYTINEAKKGGNFGKDNYSKYPKEMLFARCLTRGGKIIAPEVVQGEVQEAPEVINTPVRTTGKVKEDEPEKTPEDENTPEAETAEILEESEQEIISEETAKANALIKKIKSLKSLPFLTVEWERPENKELVKIPEVIKEFTAKKEEIVAEMKKKGIIVN